MAKKMSPERHTVYVERRQTDKIATMSRRQSRIVKIAMRQAA